LRARLCFPANSVDSWDTSPGSAEPSASDVRRGGLLLSGLLLTAVTPNFCFLLRPESRQGDPPNLSILISGGKENNSDAPSNGE